MRRRLVALAAGLALAALPAGPGRLAAQAGPSSYEELQRFSAVLNHIRTNYVDSVTYNGLVRAAIDGVLQSLDPHSWFSSREDYERLNALERGELATPGLAIEIVDGEPTVLTFRRGSPADKAGLRASDRIVAVDDSVVAGLTAKALTLKLAGEKGTKVRVRIARGPRLEPDTFTVTLKREFPKSGTSVEGVRLLDAQTGYLRLREFSPRAAEDVQDAIRRLRGMRARQVVLDLRGNPGGIVTEAVDLAAQFLPANTLVFRTEGRKKAANEEYRTKGAGAFVDLPLVVLIDEGSASAAEAFAGSMQDHDRALILGRRSFGKALMQTAFFVPDGVVMLTFGHVLTPNGRFIQRRYKGLATKQYYAYAGKGGTAADTATVYHTDHRRPMRGGGGITPDVTLPGVAAAPTWWSVAEDSTLIESVADSVGLTLGTDAATRTAWLADAAQWQPRLVVPFLAKVRARLGIAARTDPAVEREIARRLAARAAFVRWDDSSATELLAASDPDIQAALTYFPRLSVLLSGSTAGTAGGR
ncbi:MAG TPA: S41 family peptidase [Gemmatimonadales bacterium]|nr:S41 family peptidase [Gemmatimonadales bacterium]